MEYNVVCYKLGHVISDFIGTKCKCESCVEICKDTNDLSICPFCKGPIIEAEFYDDYPVD